VNGISCDYFKVIPTITRHTEQKEKTLSLDVEMIQTLWIKHKKENCSQAWKQALKKKKKRNRYLNFPNWLWGPPNQLTGGSFSGGKAAEA
jgi:protein-disulfide isomerase